MYHEPTHPVSYASGPLGERALPTHSIGGRGRPRPGGSGPFGERALPVAGGNARAPVRRRVLRALVVLGDLELVGALHTEDAEADLAAYTELEAQ